MRTDLTGKRFGKLVVLYSAPDYTYPSGQYHPMWTCQCDCGVRLMVRGMTLQNGDSRSCGCVRTEKSAQRGKARLTKHGLSISNYPEYQSWSAMHFRCYKPSHSHFEYYGGRGIQVCVRWHKNDPSGFPNFLSDMGKRPVGTSLDRIKGEFSYMPSNCRWATRKEQRANRREGVRQ